MKQKCNHSKYVFFVFFNEDRLPYTMHPDLKFSYFNFSQLRSFFLSLHQIPPLLLSLEKEAGLQDTTTKHEKIQDTLRQGKFPLTETGQGNPGGGK